MKEIRGPGGELTEIGKAPGSGIRTERRSSRRKNLALSLLFLTLFFLALLFGFFSMFSTEASSRISTVSTGTKAAAVSAETFLNREADFALDLLRESAGEDIAAGRNAMISPLSAAEVLSLCAAGAEGKTRSEMEAVIGGGYALSDFHAYVLETNQRLSGAKESKVRLANSIWMKTGLKPNKAFTDVSQKYYQAELFTVPFDRETVAKANDWADRNTFGMIRHVVDSFPDDTVISLMNAAAFQGKWKEPYEASQIWEKQTFTNASGEKEKVTMLVSSEHFYLTLGRAKGFVKEYQDGDLCCLCLLPGKGTDLSTFLKSLSGRKLRKAFLGRHLIGGADTLSVTMPEFSSDYWVDLTSALQKMGIRKAFTKSADLSFFKGGQKAGISSVMQATQITVNRKGTKAAALTGIACGASLAGRSHDYEVTLDRPFVYAILDQETGIPVFLGVVNTVA